MGLRADLAGTGLADVPTGFIDEVFDTMEAADHHVYQVLTKPGHETS